MAITVIRKCLCCGTEYNSKSAKAFLCGKRMCYVHFHRERQALGLSIADYKLKRKEQLKNEETESSQHSVKP